MSRAWQGLAGWEVEESMGRGADPLAQVLGIGQAGGQTQDADGLLLVVVADLPHPGGDDL